MKTLTSAVFGLSLVLAPAFAAQAPAANPAPAANQTSKNAPVAKKHVKKNKKSVKSATATPSTPATK